MLIRNDMQILVPFNNAKIGGCLTVAGIGTIRILKESKNTDLITTFSPYWTVKQYIVLITDVDGVDLKGEVFIYTYNRLEGESRAVLNGLRID